MSAWTLAWIGWGVYFAIVEGMALANSKPGDWTRLRRFVLLAFLAWLVVHLLTGGVF